MPRLSVIAALMLAVGVVGACRRSTPAPTPAGEAAVDASTTGSAATADAATAHAEEGVGMPERDQGAQVVANILATHAELERAIFEPLASFAALPDGARVEQVAGQWAERFLTPEARPSRPLRRVDKTVHRAATPPHVDVLRFAYTAEGMGLVVDQTARWMYVRVDGAAERVLARPVAERDAAVQDIARKLLRVEGFYDAPSGRRPYRWDFLFPDRIDRNAQFRTSNLNPMMMADWPLRVDGGIDAGGLWFLLHQRIAPTSGRQVWPDAAHWFDGRAWGRP